MQRLKAKLFFTAAIVFFALASLFLTLFNYNPYQANYTVFFLFYMSLFITLAGICTFVILFFKSRFSANQILSDLFWPSVRQGLLFSLIICLLLVFAGLKILDLWVGVPLAIAIILLELFFRGNKYKKRHEQG